MMLTILVEESRQEAPVLILGGVEKIYLTTNTYDAVDSFEIFGCDSNISLPNFPRLLHNFVHVTCRKENVCVLPSFLALRKKVHLASHNENNVHDKLSMWQVSGGGEHGLGQ